MSLPELVGSQSRYGHSNLPDVEFFDDFLADVGVAAQSPWVEGRIGSGTADHVSDADGILRLNLAGSGADSARIDFGNSLLIDITRLKYIEFGLRVNFAGSTVGANNNVVVGLANTTAQMDTVDATSLDDVPVNLWFKVAAGSNNILWETDDGGGGGTPTAVDDDDNDTGVDLVDGALTIFRIEPNAQPGATGLHNIKMYIDGTSVATPGLTDGRIAMASLTASFLVQPVVCIERQSAGSVIDSVDVDFIRYAATRSTT